jgi:hypothetical protein
MPSLNPLLAPRASWPNAQFIIRTSAAVSFRFPFVGLIFGGRTATMAARSHIADDRLRSFIDVDVLDTYRVVPFQSDGRPGPEAIELRPMFEKFLDEIDLSGNIREEVNAALRSLKPF